MTEKRKTFATSEASQSFKGHNGGEKVQGAVGTRLEAAVLRREAL